MVISSRPASCLFQMHAKIHLSNEVVRPLHPHSMKRTLLAYLISLISTHQPS
jgi:hypothetical protein